MSRTVRCVSDASGFSALRESWNQLVHDEPQVLMGHDALSTFEWFEASVAAFPEGPSARVLVSGEVSQLEGILPVVEADGRTGHLQLVTELYGGRNGPLLRRRDPQVLADLLSGLEMAFPSWSILEMTLVGSSEDERLLADLCRQFGYRALSTTAQESAFFHLPKELAALDRQIGKDIKARIRSGERKLRERGHVKVWSPRGPEEIDRFLEAMMDIERASWKHAAGSAITCHPRQERFYREVLPRFAKAGNLSAAVLTLDGLPISYSFGLIRQKVYCGLKTSMHQGYADSSPTHVLRYRHLATLLEAGVEAYDFMGVVEPHKLRWSSQTMRYTRRTWTIFRPGFKGASIYAIKRLKMQLARLWTSRRLVSAASS